MKVLLMIGSHKRHFSIAEKLFERGLLCGIVVENRGDIVPSVPKNLNEVDRKNFIYHFEERDKAEEKFFGHINIDDILDKVKHIKVDKSSLNSEETINFIKEINPDYLFTYGVHKVAPEIIDTCKEKSFNIHGGLSPWYKGCITLFWPFYFLKPNYAGMTLHRLSNRLDAGEILHHSLPKLEYGDRLHEVACKAVNQVGIDLLKILDIVLDGKDLKTFPQKTNGKLFVSRDWTPQTLRVTYNLFNDDIVDHFLDGKLSGDEPELIKQF